MRCAAASVHALTLLIQGIAFLPRRRMARRVGRLVDRVGYSGTDSSALSSHEMQAFLQCVILQTIET